MFFSYQKSPIRLWWRRQVFYWRRLSPTWLVIIVLCIIFLIAKTPYPFSAEYNQIPIDQNVHWNNVKDTLALKEKVMYLSFK